MRLEYLCEMEMAFDADPVLVRPYGGQEGIAYGQGSGSVTGERLRGSAHWVNHAHRRSDGAMLPDIWGMITTEDGAHITFSMQGRTTSVHTPRGMVGNQLLCVLFETADERLRWLNDAVCVLEGKLALPAVEPGSVGGRPRQVGGGRVYVCVNDLMDEHARGA
jgi:CO/xanthine dehydrogenase Mo-binding subunit